MLTKSLAGEWAKRGVRVNSVSPGYIGTELTKKGMSRTEWYDDWLKFTPMGRVARLQPPSSFWRRTPAALLLGSNLVVDGGYTCW